MLADHRGELESVELRHANVHQDDGDFVLEQIFQRFPTGSSSNEILSEFPENNLVGQQLRRLIIDQKDIYLFIIHHLLVPIIGAATCGWRGAAAPYRPALPDNRKRRPQGISRDRPSSPWLSAQ